MFQWFCYSYYNSRARRFVNHFWHSIWHHIELIILFYHLNNCTRIKSICPFLLVYCGLNSILMIMNYGPNSSTYRLATEMKEATGKNSGKDWAKKQEKVWWNVKLFKIMIVQVVTHAGRYWFIRFLCQSYLNITNNWILYKGRLQNKSKFFIIFSR